MNQNGSVIKERNPLVSVISLSLMVVLIVQHLFSHLQVTGRCSVINAFDLRHEALSREFS